MQRRSFIKGLLATPFVAKAILAEKPKPKWEPVEVDYSPEIKTGIYNTRGVVRDICDTQKLINQRESEMAYLMGRDAVRKWEPEQIRFSK